MTNDSIGTTEGFQSLVSQITEIGKDWHSSSLLKNASLNKVFAGKTFKDLPEPESKKKRESAVVISAGPSLHKFDLLKKIKVSGYEGTLICVDGSLIKCLKAEIIPDYVLSLDPHPTRIVRWFGDPEFEKNTEGDDYFTRQDLDIEFRKHTLEENQENIERINKCADQVKLLLCSSAPKNVVERTRDAGFDTYWWNPLVDNPRVPSSLTRRIYNICKLPCMNTGGTVGTAAWIFATTILKIPEVAVIGMDLGYHSDTSYNMTQTFYELCDFVSKDSPTFNELFPRFKFPLTGEEYYTDPTYFWYRKNMLELLERAHGNTYNCSQAGSLFGNSIKCIYFDDFLKRFLPLKG